MSQQVFALPLPRQASNRGGTSDGERLLRLLRDSDSATRTLAAWTSGPIRLDLVSRTNGRLTPEEFAELDAWQPVPVQRREVRLLDAHGRPLSEATATVVLGRLPYQTARALREDDTPLGTLLSPLHVRRHTLGVVRPGAADDDVLFDIAARLDVGGRPVALVRERYLAEVLP